MRGAIPLAVFAFQPAPQTATAREDDLALDEPAPVAGRQPRTLALYGAPARRRPAAPGKAMVTDRLARAQDGRRASALDAIERGWPEAAPTVVALALGGGATCEAELVRTGDTASIRLVGAAAATVATAPGLRALAPAARVDVSAPTLATIAIDLAALPRDTLHVLARMELTRALAAHLDSDPVLVTARELATRLGLGPVAIYRGELGRAHARRAGGRGVMDGGAVFLDEGAFDPTSADGRRLIAHELAHVAQARLAPRGHDPGARAEAEAEAFAEAFVASGVIAPLRCGVPAGQLAAEAPGLPPVPVLAAPDESPIDGVEPAVVERVDAEVTAAVDAVRAEASYQAMIDASADAASADAAAEPDASDADDDGECSDAPAADASPESASDAPAASDASTGAAAFDDALADLTATAAFVELTAAVARVSDPTGEPVQAAMVAALEAQLDPAQCDPAEHDALTAVMDAATAEGVCADPAPGRAEVQAEMGPLPVDPVALYDLTAFRESPSSGGDDADAPTGPDASAPGESPVDAPGDDAPTCEPDAPAPQEPTAARSDDLPVAPSLLAAAATTPADGATIEAAAAVAGDAASFGEAGSLDRVRAVLRTVLASALGPFATEFIRQGLDTLILDSVGRFGDVGLQAGLQALGKVGPSKVPIIGPTVMLGYELWQAVGPRGYWLANGGKFMAAVDQLGAIGPELRAALAAESTSARLHHEFKAAADFHGAVAGFCEVAAATCGVLAAVSLVGGFLIGFTGAGAAVTPEALAVAKLLADACSLLGLVAIAERGVAAVFEVLAGLAAPVDAYAAQDEAIAGAVESAATASAGFLADKAANKVRTEALRAAAAQPPSPVGREPSPKADPSPRVAAAEAARAALADEVARRTAALDEHAAAVERESPPGDLDDQPPKAPPPPPPDLDAALTAVARLLVLFPESLGQAIDDLVSSSQRLQDVAARNVPVAEAQLWVDDLSAEVDATAKGHAALTASLDEMTHEAATAAAAYRTAAAADQRSGGPPSPEVQALQARHGELLGELNAARNLLDDLDRDLRALAPELERARAELSAAERARDAGNEQDLEPPADDGPTPSSGNATGGVGSAFKPILDWLYQQIANAGAPQGDMTKLECSLDDIVELAPEVEGECPDPGEPADEGDAAASYWSAHGGAIADDVTYLTDAMPRLLTDVVAPPPVDPVDVADQLTTAADAHDEFVHQAVTAWFLDDSAAVLGEMDVAADGGGLAEVDGLVVDHATRLRASLDQTSVAKGQLATCRADVPDADGVDVGAAMGQLQTVLAETGALTTAGAPPVLDGDPFATAAEARAQLDGAEGELDDQATTLTELVTQADEHQAVLAAVDATVADTCAPIGDARDQTTAAAATQAANAADAGTRSEAAAADAAEGLSELSSYARVQGAALDALTGTCTP